MCDLNSRLRRTEVRYYCEEELMDSEAYLALVDEPESCEYVFHVRVGSLCQLTAFLPKDRPAQVRIICY